MAGAIMLQSIDKAIGDFAPISLEALNGKAAMLERLDNKYVVPADALHKALGMLAPSFDVLEIEGRRSFLYKTRYFDDKDYCAYFDHQRGRRKRCKIRIRDYVDSGLRYLEVKLKDVRDMTVKKRLRLDLNDDGTNGGELAFVEHCYRDLYGEAFGKRLRPVLSMSYRRVTLVAKEGGERMTIDSGLVFGAKSVYCFADPGMAIVETKSAKGNGLADKVLRSLHIHPTKACSKYCVGMAATGQVSRYNRFLPALRRLGFAAGQPLATPVTSVSMRPSLSSAV